MTFYARKEKIMEEEWIYEKMARVNLETAKNLEDRPDDFPIIEYIKNGPVRIIEWVKNINRQWIMRQRVIHQKWIPKIGWVDDNGPTELMQFRDFRQFNRELLPVDAFVDQGTSQPREPKFPSDKAIQRECAVSKDGKLLAFHLKAKDPVPFWKDPAWISKKLGCDHAEAIKFLETFKHLDFDRKTTLEVVRQIEEGSMTLWELELLVSEMPIVTKGPLTKGYDVNVYKEPIEEVDYWTEIEEEEEEEEPGAEVFGVHALHYEEDGCPHDFLTFLRFASIPEIKGVMKGLFPSVNEWGTKVRAKFWYLTQSQRSQVWQYVNKRREELGIYEVSVDFTK
jgi:hypothetical protein